LYYADGPGELSNRNRIDVNQALDVAKELKGSAQTFYKRIKENLPQNVEISKLDNDTRKSFREGPIVIFPLFVLSTPLGEYECRFCTTVCMGENRSKLWVRITHSDQFESKGVNEFFSYSSELVSKISNPIFNLYKIIVEEIFKDSVLHEVYDIPVMATETNDDEIGKELARFKETKIPMREALQKFERVFEISRDIIFKNYKLGVTQPMDYKPTELDNYKWISVTGKTGDIKSLFLRYRNEEKNRTQFVGFGYESDSQKENRKQGDFPVKPVVDETTKDILATISPHV